MKRRPTKKATRPNDRKRHFAAAISTREWEIASYKARPSR